MSNEEEPLWVDVEIVDGELSQDSTNYGWGFELAAMRRDDELRIEQNDLYTQMHLEVGHFVAKQTEEDEPDECLVFAIMDSIICLNPMYTPILKRVAVIQEERCHTRGRCHTKRD